MPVVHFQCPSCQAPLRLENRALFVGRNFDCPDCRETLLIEADGSTGVKAKATPSSEKAKSLARGPADESTSRAVNDLVVPLRTRPSIWDQLSRRPAVLGWIVATLFGVILLIAVGPGRQPTSSEVDSPNNVPGTAEAASSNEKSDPAETPDPQPKSEIEAALTSNAANDDPVLPVPPLPVIEPPLDDKPNPAVARTNEKLPVEQPMPAAPPTPEAIEAKLQQKIARFDQAKPVAFVKVLETVEELAGVPIVWDLEHVDEQHLQKTVTLSLKQTTVAEILDTLLKQVRLERRTVEGKIELRPVMPQE